MTFEQCRTRLGAIRRSQETRWPVVRVKFGGGVYVGRVTRADSDLDRGEANRSPYGVLVLEGLGLARAPETILQIADIPEDGLLEAEPSLSA